MGSFGGHILPGSFFIVFGVWWTTQISKIRLERGRNRERSGQRRLEKYRTFFPCTLYGYSLPLEPFIKILSTSIGICIEFNSSFKAEKNVAPDNQHIIMYLMFLINSLCEVFTYYKVLVPKGTDYFTGSLAFLIEAMLFLFHIEHQDKFEQTIHLLLIFVISLCCLTSTIEAWMPDKLSFKYIRAFFTILQGTWFWQIAFFIYNPIPGYPMVWHAASPHAQNMWVSVIFSWHCIAILTLQLLIICFSWFVKHGCKFNISKFKMQNGLELPLIEEQKTISTDCLDADDDEYYFQTKS